MATRNELIAEAKAWRKLAAETVVSPRYILGYGDPLAVPDRDCAFLMALRHFNHQPLCAVESEAPDRVLACLFLALECLDEANALKSSPSKAGGRNT